MICFGSKAEVRQLSAYSPGLSLGDIVLKPSSCIRNLDPSMHSYVSNVASACLFHLRRLRKISHVLDIDLRHQLAL
jgi:hypothetical protein